MAKLLHLFVHGPEASIRKSAFLNNIAGEFNTVWRRETASPKTKQPKICDRVMDVIPVADLKQYDLVNLHSKFPSSGVKDKKVNLIIYSDHEALQSVLTWLQELIKKPHHRIGQICLVENPMRDQRTSDDHSDVLGAEVVDLSLARISGLKKALKVLDMDKVSAFAKAFIANPPDHLSNMALYAARFGRLLRS